MLEDYENNKNTVNKFFNIDLIGIIIFIEPLQMEKVKYRSLDQWYIQIMSQITITQYMYIKSC